MEKFRPEASGWLFFDKNRVVGFVVTSSELRLGEKKPYIRTRDHRRPYKATQIFVGKSFEFSHVIRNNKQSFFSLLFYYYNHLRLCINNKIITGDVCRKVG